MKKQRIVLFGAGGNAKSAVKLLCYDYDIIAFVDNDSTKEGKSIEGVRVYEPSRLLKQDFDLLCITSQYVLEIRKQAIELGVTSEKICNYSSFSNPDSDISVLPDEEADQAILFSVLRSDARLFTFTAALPNYNDIDVIGGAIEAMLSQSFPPDELLICDDASTDDSFLQLQKLAVKHPTLRIIRNERNLGVVGTLNRLLHESKSDYIYFGGADDRVLPLFFENILCLLEVHPSAALGMASFYSVDETERVLGHNRVSRWKLPGFYSSKSCLEHYFSVEEPHHSLSSGTIYRKIRLLNLGGFKEELGHWTDSFIIRALCLESGCVYSPHPGARFTCKANSFSGSQHRDLEASLYIIDRAAEHMRSEAFRHLFPLEHVVAWKKKFYNLAQTLATQSENNPIK